MKKIIINALMGGLIGLVLSTVGAGAATWQYWVIMACACVLIAVNSRED